MSEFRNRVRFHSKARADMAIADGYASDREVGHFFVAEATYPQVSMCHRMLTKTLPYI